MDRGKPTSNPTHKAPSIKVPWIIFRRTWVGDSILLFSGIYLLIALLSCGGASKESARSYDKPTGGSMYGEYDEFSPKEPMPAAVPPPPPGDFDGKERMAPATGAKTEAPTVDRIQTVAQVTAPPVENRMMIYSAYIILEVIALDGAKQKLEQIVNDHHGFIQATSNNMLTLRVPAKDFQVFLDQIALVGRFLQKDIYSSDVTEMYMDLSLRIKNTKLMLERLEALLGKATTVEEKLKIQKEIARLKESLQSMEDQFNSLSNQIAFSTITIILQLSSLTASQMDQPFHWLESIGIQTLMNAQ